MAGQTEAEPRIHGFMHVAAIGSWREIFAEQMGKIRDSGLLERSESLHVTVLGAEAGEVPVEHPKVKVVSMPRLEEFEFPTLEALREYCQAGSGYVYYLHGKGVSRNERFVADWRRMMEYFVLERYGECVAALADHDVCGVNWLEKPVPHFSGNFWWARAEYIRTLGPVREVKVPVGRDWNFRHACEFWLGTGRGCRVACLHQSRVKHYERRYPARKYRDDAGGDSMWGRIVGGVLGRLRKAKR